MSKINECPKCHGTTGYTISTMSVSQESISWEGETFDVSGRIAKINKYAKCLDCGDGISIEKYSLPVSDQTNSKLAR